MNVSKTLASAVAAMAVVGGIGIAYAQTTSDPGSTSATSPQTMDQNNRSLSTPSTMPNDTSSMPSSSTDSSTLSNDLAPQADRG